MCDNRKSDLTEKAVAFFNIFTLNFQNQCIIALRPYLLARIFELGLLKNCSKILNFAQKILEIGQENFLGSMTPSKVWSLILENKFQKKTG